MEATLPKRDWSTELSRRNSMDEDDDKTYSGLITEDAYERTDNIL